MRKRSVIYLVFVTVVFCYCAPKIYPTYSAEVTVLNREVAQGTIAVKSAGYGKDQTEAVRNAAVNAFSVLLFKGLPGTALNLPLVENEREARAKNGSYFEKLLDVGYKSFVLSATESSSLIKEQGTKKLTVDMVINYTSLRRDLERNNIVRKLGY